MLKEDATRLAGVKNYRLQSLDEIWSYIAQESTKLITNGKKNVPLLELDANVQLKRFFSGYVEIGIALFALSSCRGGLEEITSLSQVQMLTTP